MSHPNVELLDRFYSAFAERDGETMASCYAEEARFGDPAFPDLQGRREAGGMWKMLCRQAKDLRIEHSRLEADDETGRAHWEAWYTFSPTRRAVHNVIDAEFKFRDGLIVEHTDRFDFYRWSKQAFGAAGLLLGWTPILKMVVRRSAGGQLQRYLDKHG